MEKEYFFPQGIISQLISVLMPFKDKLRLEKVGNTLSD